MAERNLRNAGGAEGAVRSERPPRPNRPGAWFYHPTQGWIAAASAAAKQQRLDDARSTSSARRDNATKRRSARVTTPSPGEPEPAPQNLREHVKRDLFSEDPKLPPIPKIDKLAISAGTQRIFHAAAALFGPQWEVTKAQTDEFAAALVDCEGILPQWVGDATSKFGPPIRLVFAAGAMVVPPLVITVMQKRGMIPDPRAAQQPQPPSTPPPPPLAPEQRFEEIRHPNGRSPEPAAVVPNGDGGFSIFATAPHV